MKKPIFLLVAFFVLFNTYAQTNYLISYTTSGGNPGGINTDNDDIVTGWTTLINSSISSNQWSTAVTLPFAFSYFGNPVTNFKASANGLVTFNTATSVLPNNNENLPTSTLPDSTIACFWDAFTNAPPTASNDFVVYQTWGTAPNRQLWIKWVSFKIGAPSQANTTFACVLEETTNNIYMVECHATATPLLTLTTGLQLNSNRAIQHGNKNKPQTVNSSTTATTENDYYTFTPYNQVAMSFVSGTCTQPIITPISNNSNNEGILRIEINTAGELTPLSISQLDFSANGSTSFNNITNAKVFYTGADSSLNTSSQFGNTITPSASSFNISGSQNLIPGKNYFWLTYSIAGNATLGNVIDAECTQLTINSTTYIPTVLAPIGSRTVTTGLTGTYTVGNGGTYTLLSDAIKDINTKRLSGDVILSIISDIEDTASVELNYSSPNPYKITIQPSTEILRNISCRKPENYIQFNGSTYVTIDGKGPTTGTGKYLRFINKDSLGGIFNFINGAQYDTLTNLIIEGTCISLTKGVINLGASTGFANGVRNIVISHNDIHDRSDSLSIPAIQIYSSATNDLPNGNISIINNNIYNFRRSGIYVNTIGNRGGWNITGNHFYYNAIIVPALGDLVPIMFIPGATAENNQISNNYIGGSAPACGGTAWQSPNGINWVAMNINSGIDLGTSIQGNTIQNINMSTTAGVDFVGVRIESGRVAVGNIIGNTVGHPTAPNSISNSARLTLCIYAFTSSLGEIIIANNTVANITGLGTTTTAGVRGISIQGGAGIPNIYNNTIYNLSSTATNSNSLTTTVMGIGLNSGSEASPAIIRNNKIFNISALATAANTVPTGILLDNNSTNGILDNNKIYNITNISTGATASITGIQIGGGVVNWTFKNNTIAITNGTNTNAVNIRGVSDGAAGNNFKFLNNTIYIGGTTSIGALNSAAYERRNTSALFLRNNIFYNERVGGTGIHAALSQTSSTTRWNSLSSNYNLLVAQSSSAVAAWGTTPAAYSFGGWQTVSLGNDLNSWSDTVANIPSSLLFINKANGNLLIDSTNTLCWYANGKGIALSDVTTDMNNQNRSTTITTGGTDIGAHEFTTTTLPPLAKINGNIQYNDSSIFTFGGRRIAKIVWNGGVLPSTVTLRYHSGVNPPSPTPGSNYLNAYYQFTESGALGLNADVTLNYDSALLGTIPNQLPMVLASNSGLGWNFDVNSNRDSVKYIITSNGVNALGLFTGTDINNPLPVVLKEFKAKASGKNAMITWSTSSEKNTNHFELLTSTDGRNFEVLTTIKAVGNSNVLNTYNHTHTNALASVSKVYYQLKTVDFDGTYQLSDVVTLQSNQTSNKDVEVSPNPFQNNLVFNNLGDKATLIELISFEGLTVYSQKLQPDVNGNATITDLNNIKPGIYFIKVWGDEGVTVNKLVKQ
jgi:hypothetical protein